MCIRDRFDAAPRDPRSEQQLDSSVFHSLFTACASEGLGKLALKTLSKMRKMNFHPTREKLVCLMEAISKSKGEEGQLEQLAFVEEICFSACWKQTHCFGMDLVGCYVRLSNKFDVVEPTLRVMRQMALLGRLDKVVFTRAAAMFVEQQQIGQMARLCTQGMTERCV